MNLVYNWSDLFKLTSVKLWSIAITLGSVALFWDVIPVSLTSHVPDWFRTICAVCALITGAAGTGARNVKQDNLPPQKP
jgi:hypothetical protein